MTTTLKLHHHPLSGHSHRAQLMLSLLKLPHELVRVELTQGEHKKPPFLEKNPLGQVPVLEDGDVVLSDSNAILVYLALRYDQDHKWLPRDPVGAARVQRWLSLAAGELARGPATLRAAALFGRKIEREPLEQQSYALFTLMERELERGSYLTGETPTVADIAFYPYTARANEGGLSLESFSAVRAWVARMEKLPGFAPFAKTDVGK